MTFKLCKYIKILAYFQSGWRAQALLPAALPLRLLPFQQAADKLKADQPLLPISRLRSYGVPEALEVLVFRQLQFITTVVDKPHVRALAEILSLGLMGSEFHFSVVLTVLRIQKQPTGSRKNLEQPQNHHCRAKLQPRRPTHHGSSDPFFGQRSS